ncbi:hypothetical protein F2Q68_00028953 [Brassica cretica]|uniref:Myosin motor domain-containing protein n=1 Tax=Brassica cretica TaxID=69181 RepID=A0A8S9GF27_BRACR|nr:hypothetical protein F2Q68_00028953 [Brassica cretica]
MYNSLTATGGTSRFGKFVEIQFDANGRISGAAIRTYLLERSRVVRITDPERNYHCFYQLCASGNDADKYKLSNPRQFHYLNQSKTYELEGVSNAEEYKNTRRAMDIVGISHDDQVIPFSAEDIDKAIPVLDPSEIEPPKFVSEYTCAQSLVKNPSTATASQ